MVLSELMGVILHLKKDNKVRQFSLGKNHCTHSFLQVQTKQNIIIRTIFFATNFGKDTESVFPLMNLLDIILSVTSILKLQALKFAHGWHSKALPNIFDNHFQYPSDIHSYDTGYTSNKSL